MQYQDMQQVAPTQERRVLDLIERLSRGDLQATQELFEIISRRIDSYCRSLTKGSNGRWEGNWKDRDDLIQDAKVQILLALTKRRVKFNSEEHFIWWAKKLAHNICVDGWRRSNKERDKIATLAVGQVSTTQYDNDKTADKWLATLSEEDREMVYLSVVEERNTREIAKIFLEKYNTKLSHNLVARHLKKALKSLRTRFESDGLS
jgi:RNA polymerase sigma factor (sigma-70 family)